LNILHITQLRDEVEHKSVNHQSSTSKNHTFFT
jgi:hypothetical protein